MRRPAFREPKDNSYCDSITELAERLGAKTQTLQRYWRQKIITRHKRGFLPSAVHAQLLAYIVKLEEESNWSGKGKRKSNAAKSQVSGGAAEGGSDGDMEDEDYDRRYRKAKAEKIELEVAREKRELLVAEDVGLAWSEFLNYLIARAAAIPTRVASQANPDFPGMAQTAVDKELLAFVEDLRRQAGEIRMRHPK